MCTGHRLASPVLGVPEDRTQRSAHDWPGGWVQVFPNVKPPPEQTADRYSPCAMKGLAVKPHRGDAVAFWSLKTDGRLDQGALHGGCPVIKGEKW